VARIHEFVLLAEGMYTVAIALGRWVDIAVRTPSWIRGRAMPILGLTLVSACTGSGTSGKRVSFQTWAETDAGELESGFDTSMGWHVDVTEGAVAFDSFYYFDGAPAVARNGIRSEAPNAIHQVLQFLGERVAHAHPGHYQAGNGLGQMLLSDSVRLSPARVFVGAGNGVTGTYRSARFRFAERAMGREREDLGAHIAFVQGVATQHRNPNDAGDAGNVRPNVVHFRVAAAFADIKKNVTNGEVDGCRFDEAEVGGDGTVTLTFKPSVWLDLVDFKSVAPGSAEAPTEIEHGSLAQLGFALGLVQLTAYNFEFSQ
jgi:hypothetical protein